MGLGYKSQRPYDDIVWMINEYGMKIVLQNLIDYIRYLNADEKGEPQEAYLKRLIFDLENTLQNYEDRYNGKE